MILGPISEVILYVEEMNRQVALLQRNTRGWR